jgi:nucleotide-binding universal stress UspA family protein
VRRLLNGLDRPIPAEVRKTLKLNTAVRTGKAYEQIVQQATETQADMVIMAARGADVLDRAGVWFHYVPCNPVGTLSGSCGSHLSGIGQG